MKIHITRSGTPAECSATVGPCPLGAHYGSVEEAVAAIEDQNKDQELPPSVKKPPRPTRDDVEREILIQEASRSQDMQQRLSPADKQALMDAMRDLNRPDLTSRQQGQANEIALILHHEGKFEKYRTDELMATAKIEIAENILDRGDRPDAPGRQALYELLSNFDGIGNDHDFMDPDSQARHDLAERLRTVLRAWEEESQIRRSTGSLWN